MARGDTKRGKAIDAIHAFRDESTLPRAMGKPYFVNTGRLVEFDADPDVIQVFVYEGNDYTEKVFLETEHFVDAVDSGKIQNIYKIDDRSERGTFLTRRIDIKWWEDDKVSIYAIEKDGRKWNRLGGTTKYGVILTRPEWDKLVEYARLELAYAKACREEK
jgi:hypothetical protein